MQQQTSGPVYQESTIDQPRGRRPVFLILLIVIAIAVLGGMGALLINSLYPKNLTDGEKSPMPFETLMKDNEEFIQAEEYLKKDQLDLAEEHYRKALALARSIDEEGQIFYKIAVMKTRRDPIGAISILKKIVAHQDYSNRQKAYAAQHMARLFRKNSSHDITKAIFTGEPYASFYTDEDERLAYRRLYEYASSFYPLAISQIAIANWYATEILGFSKKASLSTEEKKLIEDYANRIRMYITAADQDIERTRNLANAGALVPAALAGKAVVFAKMFEAGDRSFPDPESAFVSAIETGLVWKDDASARYNYAEFLVRTKGESRKQDIINLIDDFYTERETYEGIAFMLAKEKDNILGNKADIILLAKIDPAFKSFLLTLGWTEADMR